MPLLVEMGWGGLVQAPSTITWTDITQYVDVVQGVTITRGASDELSETQPGTATLVLDNSDGRFTPGNTSSPYYPFVRRNAPIRISQAIIPTAPTGPQPYALELLGDDFDDGKLNTSLWVNSYGGVSEVGGRARVPAAVNGFAAYQSTRYWRLWGTSFCVKPVTLPQANGSSSATATMMINSGTDGTRIGFSYNPVTGALRLVNDVGYFDGSATVLTYNPIDHAWWRVREASGVVYWETSGDGFGWTVRRSLATPAWVGVNQVTAELGASRSNNGTGDFAEFDLAGAKIRPRFYGMVNEFPVQWEGLYSKVQISATDLFKRLNKQPPLRSMVAQEIIADGPVAYYPLTEDAGATSAGDLSGKAATALALTQAGSGGTLEMAATAGAAETGDQHPQFTPSTASAGKYLTCDLGPVVAELMTAGYLAFECWFQTTTTTRAVLGLASADLQYQITLTVSTLGGLLLEWTDTGGTLNVETISGPTTMANGSWHHVVFDEAASDIWVDGVLVDSTVPVFAATDLRLLWVGSHRGGRLFNGSIGHVAIYAPYTSIGADLAQHYAAGATGFAGEDADQRIMRLARYAGLDSVTIWGTTHDPVASQGPGGSSVVARMREVEATESGRLWAERDWYGLAYQSRDVRYNPSPSAETFTINYADLEPGIELADDDQKMVNLVDASRPGGATQRVSAPASVLAFGEYPQDLTVLKTSDNSVLDAAAWLVSRYANPMPELREVPIEAHTMSTYLDILDAEIGSYFSVYNLPAQATAPSMRVTVEGYTETIKHNSHVITFHTSASSTDSVWVLGDPVYGVLGSTTRLAY
ncbi:LamG-like jellyroll fold domain-containing protein [Streptomyces sp. Q6]|uniref:LamG-like jellyroll fold domain-containing protein n=1 Tax=Streptomyces citrinus TaxID=3118173 RepID=A0ACD5AF99_9ACTN